MVEEKKGISGTLKSETWTVEMTMVTEVTHGRRGRVLPYRIRERR